MNIQSVFTLFFFSLLFKYESTNGMIPLFLLIMKAILISISLRSKSLGGMLNRTILNPEWDDYLSYCNPLRRSIYNSGNLKCPELSSLSRGEVNSIIKVMNFMQFLNYYFNLEVIDMNQKAMVDYIKDSDCIDESSKGEIINYFKSLRTLKIKYDHVSVNNFTSGFVRGYITKRFGITNEREKYELGVFIDEIMTQEKDDFNFSIQPDSEDEASIDLSFKRGKNYGVYSKDYNNYEVEKINFIYGGKEIESFEENYRILTETLSGRKRYWLKNRKAPESPMENLDLRLKVSVIKGETLSESYKTVDNVSEIFSIWSSFSKVINLDCYPICKEWELQFLGIKFLILHAVSLRKILKEISPSKGFWGQKHFTEDNIIVMGDEGFLKKCSFYLMCLCSILGIAEVFPITYKVLISFLLLIIMIDLIENSGESIIKLLIFKVVKVIIYPFHRKFYKWAKWKGYRFSMCNFKTCILSEVPRGKFLMVERNFSSGLFKKSEFQDFDIEGVSNESLRKVFEFEESRVWFEIDSVVKVMNWEIKGNGVIKKDFNNDNQVLERMVLILSEMQDGNLDGFMFDYNNHFGSTYCHYLSPIEILTKLEETDKFEFIHPSDSGRKYYSGSEEISVNPELINSVLNNLNGNINAVRTMFFHWNLFFKNKGVEPNPLQMSFICPGKQVSRGIFGMGNSEFKKYTSDLSRLFVHMGLKPLYRITMLNESEALRKCIKAYDSGSLLEDFKIIVLEDKKQGKIKLSYEIMEEEPPKDECEKYIDKFTEASRKDSSRVIESIENNLVKCKEDYEKLCKIAGPYPEGEELKSLMRSASKRSKSGQKRSSKRTILENGENTLNRGPNTMEILYSFFESDLKNREADYFRGFSNSERKKKPSPVYLDNQGRRVKICIVGGKAITVEKKEIEVEIDFKDITKIQVRSVKDFREVNSEDVEIKTNKAFRGKMKSQIRSILGKRPKKGKYLLNWKNRGPQQSLWLLKRCIESSSRRFIGPLGRNRIGEILNTNTEEIKRMNGKLMKALMSKVLSKVKEKGGLLRVVTNNERLANVAEKFSKISKEIQIEIKGRIDETIREMRGMAEDIRLRKYLF